MTFCMNKSDIVCSLFKEAYNEFQIRDHNRVSIVNCWMEQGDGTKIEADTTIENLWKENHGTYHDPLIFKLESNASRLLSGTCMLLCYHSP